MLEVLGEDGFREFVELLEDDARPVGVPGDQVAVQVTLQDIVELGQEGRHHRAWDTRRIRRLRDQWRFIDLALGPDGVPPAEALVAQAVLVKARLLLLVREAEEWVSEQIAHLPADLVVAKNRRASRPRLVKDRRRVHWYVEVEGGRHVLGLRASRLACFGAARARVPSPVVTWLRLVSQRGLVLESRRAGKRLVRFALARSR